MFIVMPKEAPSSTRLAVGLSVGGQHCAAFHCIFQSPECNHFDLSYRCVSGSVHGLCVTHDALQ